VTNCGSGTTSIPGAELLVIVAGKLVEKAWQQLWAFH
jgi:hypothetical protein